MPRKVTDDESEAMKVLWANGCTVTQLQGIFGYSRGTIFNHVNGVRRLPLKYQRNPFLKLERGRSIAEQVEALRDEEAYTPRELVDVEYFKEEHEPGTRWEGSVDGMSVEELAGVMEEPTGFKSGLSSVQWFNKYAAPYLFKGGGVLSPAQVELMEFLDGHPRSLVETWRGFGKTSVMIGRMTHDICEGPENKYVVQSSIIDISKRRVSSVREMLMSNKLIIADYGYLPHLKVWRGLSRPWKAGEFTVKRRTIDKDPTLMALSWRQGGQIGMHVDGAYFDDVWSFKLQSAAPESVENWLDWYDGEFLPCMEEAKFEHFICTRKGLNDVYSELEGRNAYHVFKLPAIKRFPDDYEFVKDANGVVVGVKFHGDPGEITDSINGRFTMEKYLMLRESMRASQTKSFEQEYQLNPLPPKGIALDWENLRFFRGLEVFWSMFRDARERKKVRMVGMMDMAFGKSDRADFTALVIVALYAGNYYFLECYLKRGASTRLKAQMIDNAAANFPGLREVYIESDFQQSSLIDELKTYVRHPILIRKIRSREEESALGRNRDNAIFSNKDKRILTQLEVPIELNNLWINEKMQNFDEFEREFRYFPKSPHKDVIDALGNAVSILKPGKAVLFCYSGR